MLLKSAAVALVVLTASPVFAANIVNEDASPYTLNITQEPGTDGSREVQVNVPAGNSLDSVCPDHCTMSLNGSSVSADGDSVIVIRQGKLAREG